MQKAIFSKVYFSDVENLHAQQFLSCIEDIVNEPTIQELKNHFQHMNTTRFQHSINVAYYSFLISRKLNLDTYSVTRAGLLHDLYFYDWRDKDQKPLKGNHCSIHPKVALENAKEIFELNPIIEDAILNHMWPLSAHMPKTKEGWLLQAIDKYCAVCEVLSHSSQKLLHVN